MQEDLSYFCYRPSPYSAMRKKGWIASVVIHIIIVVFMLWEASLHQTSSRLSGNTLSVSFISEKTLKLRMRHEAQPIPVDLPGKGVPVPSRYEVDEAGQKNRDIQGHSEKTKDQQTASPKVHTLDGKKASRRTHIHQSENKHASKEQRQSDPFASVLKTLDSVKEKPRKIAPKTERQKKFEQIMDQSVEGENNHIDKGVFSRGVMTHDELEALKRQIVSCWNLPLSAIDAGDFEVTLSLTVDKNKHVQDVQVQSSKQGGLTDREQALVQSALRAVHNPACRTLHLPKGKYDVWHQINMTFKPSQMVGDNN